jgi:hypothetical protein
MKGVLKTGELCLTWKRHNLFDCRKTWIDYRKEYSGKAQSQVNCPIVNYVMIKLLSINFVLYNSSGITISSSLLHFHCVKDCSSYSFTALVICCALLFVLFNNFDGTQTWILWLLDDHMGPQGPTGILTYQGIDIWLFLSFLNVMIIPLQLHWCRGCDWQMNEAAISEQDEHLWKHFSKLCTL